MPTGYRPYRINGEIAERGPEISTINRADNEGRYGLRVRNILSKQDKNVFRGRITLENSEETTRLREGIGADKFALQVDQDHNIDLIEKDDGGEDPDFTEQEVLKSTEKIFFTVLNDFLMHLFSEEIDQALLESILNIELEEINITPQHIETHLGEIQSASWRGVDEHTTRASVTGDVENSDYLDNRGEPVWAVGQVELKEETHTVGLSVPNNTVVLYDNDNTISSAELVKKVTQINN